MKDVVPMVTPQTHRGTNQVKVPALTMRDVSAKERGGVPFHFALIFVLKESDLACGKGRGGTKQQYEWTTQQNSRYASFITVKTLSMIEVGRRSHTKTVVKKGAGEGGM